MSAAREKGEDMEWARAVALPLDYFVVDGPNGSRNCFVYPVLGPRVPFGNVLKAKEYVSDEEYDRKCRKLNHKMTLALVALHAKGICHGGMSSIPSSPAWTSGRTYLLSPSDLRRDNVVHPIKSLAGLSEGELLKMIEEPKKMLVVRSASPSPNDGEPGSADSMHVPKYLVRSADRGWLFPHDLRVLDEIRLINIGLAFTRPGLRPAGPRPLPGARGPPRGQDRGGG